MSARHLAPAVLLVVAGGLSATSAEAALLTFSFTGHSLNATAASSVGAESLSFGSGWTPTTTTDDGDASFAATPVLFEHWSGTTNKSGSGAGPFGEDVAASEAASVTDGDYLEFTFTPLDGKVFDLTKITFDVAIGAAGGSNGIRFFLRSDRELIDYATTIGSASSISTSVAAATITLDSTFEDVSGPVTFRLYGYDRGSTSSSNNRAAWHLDNLVLEGAVVPEPASLALVGLGGLAILARRRHEA